MSRPTLVFIKAHYIDGRIVHYFGDEMPPRLFAQEVINRLLADGVLAEYEESNRPSLYRRFSAFIGCKEQE